MMGAPDGPAQPPGPGRDAGILRERDRIALKLQNEVIQRVFAVGLNLQSTAAITTDPRVRRQVDQAIDDLDHVIRALRDTVFDLEARLMSVVKLFGPTDRRGFRPRLGGLGV